MGRWILFSRTGEKVLRLLGGRWKLAILYHLFRSEPIPLRFSELERLIRKRWTRLADRVGYSSQSAFSHAFKRVLGAFPESEGTFPNTTMMVRWVGYGAMQLGHLRAFGPDGKSFGVVFEPATPCEPWLDEGIGGLV